MQFRRVVTAIDGSPTSLAALEATAGLASVWHSEVIGLLIEDPNLLRMASLPFSREVGTHSGAFRTISPDDIEHQFHSQADRARNTLWYTAERYRLTASFSVVRGPVAEELTKASLEADLLCLGKGGESVAAQAGLGKNAKTVIEAAKGVVMLFSHVANVTGPVAVVYDGSSNANRALEASIELAKVVIPGISVIVPASDQNEMDALSTEASNILSVCEQQVSLKRTTNRDGQDLARIARSMGANLVVVPAGEDAKLASDNVQKLATTFFGPVMIVGASAD